MIRGMPMFRKHFVMFYSPGTFFAETTQFEIDSWDVDTALELYKSVPNGLKPYAFRFITRERADDELDSHISDSSNTYFINGKLLTIDDVKELDGDHDILIENMNNNGYEYVVQLGDKYKFYQPFKAGDTLVEV